MRAGPLGGRQAQQQAGQEGGLRAIHVRKDQIVQSSHLRTSKRGTERPALTQAMYTSGSAASS